MINISIHDTQITAEGHASTLICNSVSVLMWALAVSLDNAGAKELYVNMGDGYQMVSLLPDDKTEGIFKGISESLKLMAAEYPKEIKIL